MAFTAGPSEGGDTAINDRSDGQRTGHSEGILTSKAHHTSARKHSIDIAKITAYFAVMTCKYRSAKRSDAVACSQLIRDWDDETQWATSPLNPSDVMAEFWGDLFDSCLAWVAEADTRIVGFCARCDDNIAGLYIAREARNCGVGKALLDLAKANREWITVWAYEKNERARQFYRREGLVEVSREVEVFDDGSSLTDVEHRWIRST